MRLDGIGGFGLTMTSWIACTCKTRNRRTWSRWRAPRRPRRRRRTRRGPSPAGMYWVDCLCFSPSIHPSIHSTESTRTRDTPHNQRVRLRKRAALRRARGHLPGLHRRRQERHPRGLRGHQGQSPGPLVWLCIRPSIDRAACRVPFPSPINIRPPTHPLTHPRNNRSPPWGTRCCWSVCPHALWSCATFSRNLIAR